MHAREVLQFRDAMDLKVSGAGVVVKTVKKWRAEAALEQAELWLCHGVLVGTETRTRPELRNIAAPVMMRLGTSS